MSTECKNLYDIGETFSNTNKSTINLLPKLSTDPILNYVEGNSVDNSGEKQELTYY
jgi:hypothetical protein